MDVLVYFTIVTIVAILENANKMKANSCETNPNNNDKCFLTVTNGKPCYFSNQATILASISCDSMFTFNAQTTFTCTGSGSNLSLKPAETAECSPIGTISLKPTPTMSFTSKSLLSGSSLSSVISTGTPSLETYTTMPRTEINTLSTDFQTDPSAITPFTSSPRLAATSSTIVVASSILVTPDPAASQRFKESDINAAYIAVPVVVCVIALLLGVGIIWWRRRKLAMNKTPVCDGDTSQQVPEYTELNMSQVNSNPYSALSKTNHRFVRDRTVTDNNDSMYLTPCTITNPDVSQEDINIDA